MVFKIQLPHSGQQARVSTIAEFTGRAGALPGFRPGSLTKCPDGTIYGTTYAITGKTYTIEHSSDALSWTWVPFSIGTTPATDLSYTATGVSILSAFAAPQAGASKELFRLTVR